MRLRIHLAFLHTLVFIFSISILAATAVNGIPHYENEVGGLISALKGSAQNRDESFALAAEIIGSIKLSPPSCNQIAASRLITPCESIGQKPDTSMKTDTNFELENAQSVYAARLALCELSGAGASMPQACLSINAPPGQQKRTFGFFSKRVPAADDDYFVSTEVLEPCLRALESRPQWWTSYSNNKQNAEVICQAARIEKEKREILELYNTLRKSTVHMNDGLQAAQRMADEESASHRDFVHSTELLRQQTLRDTEESMSSLVHKFDGASQELLSKQRTAFEAILLDLGDVRNVVMKIEKDLQDSSSEAGHLRQELQSIHEENLSRGKELASTQQQNTATHNELAIGLQSQLQSIAQNDVAKLGQGIKAVDESLEWFYSRIALVLQQQEIVSQRLLNINSSLDEIQLRTDNLHEIQQRQYETTVAQFQLQENLYENMRISKELLDQIASRASNLQSMIDEWLRGLFDVPILGWLFNIEWSWVALLLGLKVAFSILKSIAVFLKRLSILA
ncbi:hypothetical protein BJY04DRAFT_214449 [Aspergillus karnatakaensis]|uniref:putative nuclear membrane fusion protein Kar5 n=1 Tax=Aspergillus karnatakaensis TaxID=1810916 RepID=UPI003CCE114F